MLREVKLALLEADVNYMIVKEFIGTIQEKALGQDVLKSLTPGQQVVKIVKDELIELLGGTESKINFTPNPPTIIMLVGLQGSGKTTLWDYKAQERQQQLENWQISYESKGKNHCLLLVMYIGQQR